MRCSTGIPLGPDGLHAYFVHSYSLKASDASDVLAQADYGGPVTAMVARGNHRRHPVSSREEPETWACADRQFSEMEAVTDGAARSRQQAGPPTAKTHVSFP